MSLSQDITIPNYMTYIRGVFYSHLSPILEPQKFVRRVLRDDVNSVIIEVQFIDESNFRGIQSFTRKGKGFEIVRYSYEYTRPSGFFFQFEFELLSKYQEFVSDYKSPDCFIYKPQSHLHVGASKEVADKIEDFPKSLREHDGPHYYSIPVTIDYIVALIVSNYFRDDIDDLSFLKLTDYIPS